MLRSIVGMTVLMALTGPALAAGLPTAPILRIETGKHTAHIWRIASDATGRYLITASHDKSLRIWELPGGRLVRTIRPPVGEGNDGALSAVALSPDGGTIACGGRTQVTAAEGYVIYLFNRASGRMVGRITGLSDVIYRLAFSPDGRYLSATLWSGGVKVYRTSDWSLAGEDKEYGDQSYSTHFSRDGRMVTACYDGFLRLYEVGAQGLRLLAKEKAPGGNQPYVARFSPDGSKIAVGYSDSPKVSVLSARDLALLYSPDVAGVDGAKLFIAIAWSPDGRFLYGGGTATRQFDGVWSRCVRRWADAGRGEYLDIPAAINTILDLAPLPDGRIAFGSYEPAFGVIDPGGRRTLLVQTASADYRDNWSGFQVSGDATSVKFGYEQWGKTPASFDMLSRTLTPGDASGADLRPPITAADGLAIDGWKYTLEPKLNGSTLKLSVYEQSRSLAIAPDGSSFFLGADWNLRRFDRQGNVLWRVSVASVPWGVNVAGNGSVVLAALGDGTIRWYRLSDGKELLAFFPHSDRKRWVLWTPAGYYDASPGGEELIGWHVNNGKEQTADFFPASKFRNTYYRPDVIAKVLDTLDQDEALRLANDESGRRQNQQAVANLLPPVVSIASPADGSTVKDTPVTLRYTVRTPADAPVTAVRVLVDGRPAGQQRGVRIKGQETGEQSIDVAIPRHDCELSLIAENRHAASEPATVRIAWAGNRQQREEFNVQPKLYVLAVGVSSYSDPGLSLKYAAKDARDFAAAIAGQKGGLYRDVVVKVLPDASKDEILDGLEWLQKETTARDVGIVFLAGHGVNDSTGNYYFLPANADTERLKRTGVEFATIKSTVASLAGKAVLFVDTCHSGNVMGTRRGGTDINAVVNELAAAENGAVVFASSTGRQYSLEDDAWGNGAFTKALVEGLSGKADFTGKGKITINMLDLYLSERVKELTRGQQTPTTTKPQTIQDFPLAVRK